MDASTLAKSAKALILASGLIVASTVVGAAQDAPGPLATTATVALKSWYPTPPSGQALLGGGTAVIGMLSIPVTTAGKTVTTVTVTDTNAFGALHIQLAGLTVDFTPPTPTPTPTPICTMNDHAGKTSAEKAQNVPHCI